MEECASQRTKQASELVSDRAKRQVYQRATVPTGERTTSERAKCVTGYMSKTSERTNARVYPRANLRLGQPCDWANLATESQANETRQQKQQSKADGAADEQNGGRKIPGDGRGACPWGRAHAGTFTSFLCQGSRNEPIEDGRARRGGGGDETDGLGAGRKAVCAPKAPPPRARLLGRRARPVFFLAQRDARYFTQTREHVALQPPSGVSNRPQSRVPVKNRRKTTNFKRPGVSQSRAMTAAFVLLDVASNNQ